MAQDQGSEDDEKQNRHPKTAYDAKYPYNRVEITESGHEIHYDDTPGKERIRVAHRTGTYWEISPKGRKVEMVVDNDHHYVKGGLTQTIDKNHDYKVQGSARSNIKGHDHKEIKGHQTRAIGKDSKVTVGGDSVSAVKGDQTHGVVGETTFKMGKGLKVKGDDKMDMKIDGQALIEFGNEVTLKAESKITFKVGSSTIVMTSGNITITADKIDLKSSGDITTKGATTKIQGGGAGAPPTTFT